LIKKEREKKKSIAFALAKSCFFTLLLNFSKREKRDPKIESDPRERPSKTARETASRKRERERERERERALCAK
jgi:hypothetical protein